MKVREARNLKMLAVLTALISIVAKHRGRAWIKENQGQEVKDRTPLMGPFQSPRQQGGSRLRDES